MICVWSAVIRHRIRLCTVLGLGMGLVKQTCEVRHDEVCPIQMVIASVFGRLNGRNGNTSEACHFQMHPPGLQFVFVCLSCSANFRSLLWCKRRREKELSNQKNSRGTSLMKIQLINMPTSLIKAPIRKGQL